MNRLYVIFGLLALLALSAQSSGQRRGSRNNNQELADDAENSLSDAEDFPTRQPRFGGQRFRDQRFESQRFGGQRFGGPRFGGPRFGGQRFGGPQNVNQENSTEQLIIVTQNSFQEYGTGIPGENRTETTIIELHGGGPSNSTGNQTETFSAPRVFRFESGN